MIDTCLAPAFREASFTARRSTSVTPAGLQMTTLGLERKAVEGGSRCLLSRCSYFTLTRLTLSGRMEGCCCADSFQLLLAVSGSGTLSCGSARAAGYRAGFRAGDSFFLPAGCGEYILEGDAVLLRATL